MDMDARDGVADGRERLHGDGDAFRSRCTLTTGPGVGNPGQDPIRDLDAWDLIMEELSLAK